jgi:hypothetical protein
MNNTKKCIKGNNERKGRKKEVKAKYLDCDTFKKMEKLPCCRLKTQA